MSYISLPPGWEDLIIAIGGWALNYGAYRALRSPYTSIPLSHSGLYAVVLVAFTVAYVSLGLYAAAVSTAVGALLWALIAVVRRPRPGVAFPPNTAGDP